MPPSARSKRPARLAWAPEKAPRSAPNSSDSISGSGIAAQLSATKGLSTRFDNRCSMRANTSLPTPLSPRNSTVACVGATRRTMWHTVLKLGEMPTGPSSAAASFGSAISPTGRSPRGAGRCPDRPSGSRKRRSCAASGPHSSTSLPTMRQASWPIDWHSTSR